MRPDRQHSGLRRFFAGAAEYVFQTQLGVADPRLIDYLSDLLTRFVRWDALYRLRDLAGRPLQEIVDMVAEAEARLGDARREAHRHIGDVTLFWTGVYPEALGKLRRAGRKDYFVDYCAQGKRSYLIASEIEPSSEEEAPGDVLERLGRQYELCAYGLREVRREWERREGDQGPPRPILIN